METVLVTGATGFLGEYLVRRLTGKYRVLALGRNRERGAKLERAGAVFCRGDFTDKKTCEAFFRGVAYVIHAGALSTAWGAWKDFYSTNVLGTKTVAQLCLEYGVKRLVYLSSPSIYTAREDRYGIKEAQVDRKNRLNGYIRSKIMAEQVLESFSRGGLDTVILRPRGLIGIGDTSLAPRLLRANQSTGIPLFRNGSNLVDLTSVENAALACELAMVAEHVSGQAFNITNGEPMEFRKILDLFMKAIGDAPNYKEIPFPIVYGAASALEAAYRLLRLGGEPPLTRYTVCTLAFGQTMDIGKAREKLGYCPEKTLEETVEEYGGWWRRQKTAKETEGVQSLKIFKSPSPPSGDRKILRVRLYHCGSCRNNLKLLFRDRGWEKREFPALAVLLEHKDYGNVLFDAGYSEAIFRGGLAAKFYRTVIPVHLERPLLLSNKLEADGISPDSIRTVILSHPHPDHMGGLNLFSGYELISTPEVLHRLKTGRSRHLIFNNMLPEKSRIKRLKALRKEETGHFLCRYFDRVYDIFGDESVMGIRLDGHWKGQMGIFIQDFSLLFAADACWGRDLVRSTAHMRFLPKMIQNDFQEYRKTLSSLIRLKRDFPQIKVYFTHQLGGEEVYE